MLHGAHLQKHQIQCPPLVSLPTHHRIRLCEVNIEWSIWFTLLIKEGYRKIYVRDLTVLQIFPIFWNFLKPYEKPFLIKCKIRIYFITDIIFVIILLSLSLTLSFLIHPFSTPWKHQKSLRFSDVFRSQRMAVLGTNGLTSHLLLFFCFIIIISYLWLFIALLFIKPHSS